MTIALKAFVVWIGILAMAVANGALREGVLIPILGSALGLIASGLILSTLIVAAACLALPWIGARRAPEMVVIGVGWLALTLAFEISFGLLRGESPAQLLEAYTFTGGNIWPLVLLVTAAAPYVAARVRRIL